MKSNKKMKNRKNNTGNLEQNTVIRKLVMFLISITIIFYVIFAILPDVFNVAFLPTGGWDWLSYIGVLIASITALIGVIITLEESQKQLIKQNQLAVIPYLNFSALPGFRKGKMNFFRKMEDSNHSLINSGYVMTQDNTLPSGFQADLNIIIENFGLSTAFQIDTIVYKLIEIEGQSNLSDYVFETNRDVIENFYERIKVSNYHYFENEELKKDSWQLFTSFNIPPKDDFKVVLSFDISNIKEEYHSIIELRYSDIYRNNYYQLIYIRFDDKDVITYPCSKVFYGKSICEDKNFFV